MEVTWASFCAASTENRGLRPFRTLDRSAWGTPERLESSAFVSFCDSNQAARGCELIQRSYWICYHCVNGSDLFPIPVYARLVAPELPDWYIDAMAKKRTPEAARQVEHINLVVGQHMEAAMKARGENFYTLAEKAGMARPVVWRLMKGKRRANVEQIARIAKALNMDAGELVPSELLAGDDVPKKSGTAARTKTATQTSDRGNSQQESGDDEAPAFGLLLEEYLRRGGHELTTEECRLVTGWYKVAQGAVIDEQVIKDFLKAWRAHNERVAMWMAEGGRGRK